MRNAQALLVKGVLLLLLLASAGVAAWHYPLGPVREALARMAEFLPDSPDTLSQVGLATAAIVAFAAMAGLLPLPAGVGRRITFTTPHGTVTIALGPVYRTLYKLVRKLPEVRACRLDIRLGVDGNTLQVIADVRLNKMPRQPGRDTAQRVSGMIHDAAVGLLGIGEVVSVDLNVRDFTVDLQAAVAALRHDHPAPVDEPLNLEGIPVVRMDEVEVPEFDLDAESLEAFEEPVADMLREDDLPSLQPESIPAVSEEAPEALDVQAAIPDAVEVTIPKEQQATESRAVEAELEAAADDGSGDALPPLEFDEDRESPAQVETPSQEEEEKKRKDDAGGPWSL